MNDLGIKDDCLNGNYTYYFFHFDYDEKFMKETSYGKILKFTDQKHFFFGLCFVNECAPFFLQFFNSSLNAPFFKVLNNEGITKVSVYNSDHDGYKIRPEDINKSFKVFCVFMILYIGSRFVISMFGIIYVDYSKRKKEKNEGQFSDDKSAFSELSAGMNKSIIISPSNFNKTIKQKDNCFNFYKFFSIRRALGSLFSKTNNHYDDTNIDFINGLRVYSIFWYLFNHNYYVLSIIPNRYNGNTSFYNTFFFFFVKYATFSSIMLVFLDAVQFSFKFFSFVKKNRNAGIRNCIIFYGNFMSKIFIFYFSFFAFHIGLNNIAILIGKGNFYEYFEKTRMANRVCYTDPMLAFIPFALQYGCNNKLFDYVCYKYIYLFSTEFYCMTFVLIIFYLSHKIKSLKFDIFATIIILVGGFISFLYLIEFERARLNITIILGESLYIQKVEMMIFSYFLGVLTGIIYFYYCDVLTENPVKQNNEYIPFKFCISIMKLLDKLHDYNWLRITLIILSFMIKLFICCAYTIYLYIYTNKSNMFDVPFNEFFRFFFIFEKNIFIISFSLFLTLIAVSHRYRALKNALSYNWIICCSRVGFIFTCNTDSIIYLFYGIYDFQAYMNYNNLFVIAIGLFLLNLIFSIFLVVLFEIPLRQTYKKLTRPYIIKSNKIKNEKLIE